MLLDVSNLTKEFKGFGAVRDISFQIEEGKSVALLGPNGSGKTTTLSMLAGLLEKTTGSIRFMGSDILERHEIGYLPQYPAFFPWMTAFEYLQFAGRLSNMTKQRIHLKSKEMLYFVGLEDSSHKRIGGFSGGMKQRLGLAQALLHDPKLLLLDEPVSALDPAGRRDVLNMMHELKEKMAILFSTHVLHDAEQVCDEMVVLQKGEIKWQGSLERLREEKAEDVFSIKTKEPLIKWLNERAYIQQTKQISHVEAEVELVHDEVRRQLLQDLLTDGYTIEAFMLKQKSLEDIYLEVVQG